VVREVEDFSHDNSAVMDRNEDYTTAVMDVDLYVAPARPPMKRTDTSAQMRAPVPSAVGPDQPASAARKNSIDFVAGNETMTMDTEQVLAMGTATARRSSSPEGDTKQGFSNTTGEDFSVTSIMNILEVS
jgi:hypothetical protein